MSILAPLLAAAVQVPGPPDQNPIRAVSVRGPEAAVRAGETFEIRVLLSLNKGWHVYPTESAGRFGKPTRFEFVGPVMVAGRIEHPEPHRIGDDPEFEQWVLEGDVEFRVPLKAKGGAEGRHEIEGKLLAYTCSDVLCIDSVAQFTFPIEIAPGEAGPEPSAPVEPVPPPSVPEQPEGETEFFGFLLAAVGGGLATLVFPCVFPLIPVTITYFVKQGAGSRAATAVMGQMYAAGIVVSFTLIGAVFSVAFGTTGVQDFVQSPWVNLGIAALFFAFALSMFGVFEIRPPAFLLRVASARRSGAIGAFVLGLAFAIVTFTCTAPVAATILGFAATKKIAWALPGLLAYSGTLALPFFLLSLFPGLIARIPKGGGWLNEARVSVGFIELALVTFYLWRGVTNLGMDWPDRDTAILVWTVSMGFVGLYLLGLFRWKGDVPVQQVGVLRCLFAGAFAVLALTFYTGLGGRPLGILDAILPVEAKRDEGVLTSLEEAEQTARGTRRPIFVEFTAST